MSFDEVVYVNARQGAPWHDAEVALATKHGKEAQIAPALATVGLVTRVVALDTDQFGTFAGEIERPAPASEVVLLKARAGLEALGLPRGVASEGTLGPYPELPLLTYDQELVGYVDLEFGFTLIEEALSFETMAASVRARPGDDLGAFLNSIDFGPQGVIVKRGDQVLDPIAKGVVTYDQLMAALEYIGTSSTDGGVIIETDQRAHLCPTRSLVIKDAANRLAERLARRCPACSCPGFGVVEHEAGLACSACGSETSLDRAVIEGCPRCGERVRIPLIDQADPSMCPMCNP